VDLKLLRELAEDWPSPVTLRTIVSASPAVATDFTITTPGESVWMLVALEATLTADANVANRHPDLTVTDGTNPIWRIPPGVSVTASQTAAISWVPSLGYTSATLLGNRLAVGIPDLILQSGWTVGPTGSNLQAGDQWSAITTTVVEVFHGHVEHERSIADQIRDRADAFAEIFQGVL
jgi:hypothetical protein